MLNTNFYSNLYIRLGLTTIIAVYILILIGGIVRSTGSGMGCPDWPQCFGQWVPPTDVSQLPSNYKDIYAQKRKQKNERIAKTLNYFGVEVSATLLQDQSMYEEADFNALKTWIEYINRLVGVLIGLFIFATLLASITYWRHDKWIFVASFISFILVGIEGWLGSIVVSTNLLPNIITIHMLLAVIIVCLLIWAVGRAYQMQYKPIGKLKIPIPSTMRYVLWLALVLSIVQLILGTRVREMVDIVAKAFGENQRANWLTEVGLPFYIHRSFSWLLVLVNGGLGYYFYKKVALRQTILFRLFVLLLSIVISEILTGVVMAYWSIPALAQPIHLLQGSLLIGVQFFMLFLLYEKEKKTNFAPEKQLI